MWSFELKPQIIEHGRPGKFNKFIYVVDIYLSGHIVERHLFFNQRKYVSFAGHVSVFPSSSIYGLSVSSYIEYFEEYHYLNNFD